MWESQLRRLQRRRRFNALVKYFLVFVLGGLVTLAVMPYFSAGVVNRITELQGTVDERVSDWIPAVKDRAALLQLVDQSQLVARSEDSDSLVESAVNPSRLSRPSLRTPVTINPYTDLMPNQVSVGSNPRFQLADDLGVWTTKTMKIVKIWSSDRSGTVIYEAPSVPYTMFWEKRWRGTTDRTFGVYFTSSEQTDRVQAARGGNSRVINELGEVSFEVESPGWFWHMYALVDP